MRHWYLVQWGRHYPRAGKPSPRIGVLNGYLHEGRYPWPTLNNCMFFQIQESRIMRWSLWTTAHRWERLGCPPFAPAHASKCLWLKFLQPHVQSKSNHWWSNRTWVIDRVWWIKVFLGTGGALHAIVGQKGQDEPRTHGTSEGGLPNKSTSVDICTLYLVDLFWDSRVKKTKSISLTQARCSMVTLCQSRVWKISAITSRKNMGPTRPFLGCGIYSTC